jgi:hypothetical protein
VALTPEDLTKFAGLGVVSTGVFTGIAGALVSTDGGLERVERNHPVWTILALTALALALTAAFVIFFVRKGKSKAQKRIGAALTVLTFAAFLFGVTFSIVAAFYTAGDLYQPRIAASITKKDGVLALVGDVHAAGLRFDQHVKIRVFPVVAGRNGRAIYLADEGADDKGLLDVQLELPITPSRADHLQIEAWVGGTDPDCARDLNNIKVDLSCLSLALPADVSRPQLAAEVSGANPSVISLTVKQSGVRDDQTVALRIVSTTAATTKSEFYSSNIAPRSDGTVDQVVKVPVPRNARKICVAAKVIPNGTLAALACPGDVDTAWSQITPVPRPT